MSANPATLDPHVYHLEVFFLEGGFLGRGSCWGGDA